MGHGVVRTSRPMRDYATVCCNITRNSFVTEKCIGWQGSTRGLIKGWWPLSSIRTIRPSYLFLDGPLPEHRRNRYTRSCGEPWSIDYLLISQFWFLICLKNFVCCHLWCNLVSVLVSHFVWSPIVFLVWGTYLTLTAVIVHGHGCFMYLSSEALTEGSNWNWECVPCW